MNLALFDFDGTISTNDSYLFFTHFLHPKSFFIRSFLLSPRIAAYLLGKYPNYKLKEDFLRYFYKGKTLDDLNHIAQDFCAEKLPGIIRPGAIERIQWHQQQGDDVVVVSASLRFILEPWCNAVGIDIMATECEVDRYGRMTGKIKGKNCWGEEKVRRINSRYDSSTITEIFAYGDSSGDLPMLRMATAANRYFKPFR